MSEASLLTPEEMLRYFDEGYDTFDIAKIFKIDEGDAYNAIGQARTARFHHRSQSRAEKLAERKQSNNRRHQQKTKAINAELREQARLPGKPVASAKHDIVKRNGISLPRLSFLEDRP